MIRFHKSTYSKKQTSSGLILHGFFSILLSHFIYFFSYELNQYITIVSNILILLGFLKAAKEPYIFKLLSNFRDLKYFKQQLLEAKQQLEFVTGQSKVGIVIVNDTQVVYCNQYMMDISGLSGQELKNWKLSDLIRFFNPEADNTVTNKNLKEDFSVILLSEPFYRIKTAQGVKYLELFHNEITFDGEPATQIILFDRTERKQLEEERDRERLKRTQLETVSLLAGGIAHDFNNILVSVLGNISLLEMDKGFSEKQTQLIENSKSGALQARELVSQLLTLSKGGAPIKESASIVEIIKDSAALILSGSNSVSKIDVENPIPNIDVDVTQFSQVINNLLMNAKQAMPDGGTIQITIEMVPIGGIDTASIQLKRGRYLRIKIADEGVGIPPENRDNIFIPYFTTKTKGNGLGLATSYSIIKKHGGHINFESEVGVGTTFYIYLPIIQSREIKGNDVNIEDEMSFDGKNILVLEDDKGIQNFLSAFFKEYGALIDSVYDGDDALNLLHENKYDLVIMDVTIAGGKGGKETIEEFRKFDVDTPVIVSSGFTEEKIIAEFEKHGFNGYLKKPYTTDEIVRVVKKCLS